MGFSEEPRQGLVEPLAEPPFDAERSSQSQGRHRERQHYSGGRQSPPTLAPPARSPGPAHHISVSPQPHGGPPYQRFDSTDASIQEPETRHPMSDSGHSGDWCLDKSSGSVRSMGGLHSPNTNRSSGPIHSPNLPASRQTSSLGVGDWVEEGEQATSEQTHVQQQQTLQTADRQPRNNSRDNRDRTSKESRDSKQGKVS